MRTIRHKHFKDFVDKFVHFIKTPHGFFLSFTLSFGLLFVFLTPPIQVYDERSHFFQAYAVSNLDIFPDKLEYLGKYHYGAYLPQSVFIAAEKFITGTAGNVNAEFDTNLYKQYLFQDLDSSNLDKRESGTTYSPVVYIPQVIGITIGKIFNTSPLIMLWLGRLMNLVFWTAIIFISIRIIPFGKWAMAILALNPMAVFLSASLSADVMTTALAFLFFSLVASAYASRKSISMRYLTILFIVQILLVLTKPTNIVFSLLLLGIPINNIKNKYFKLAYFIVVTISAFLVAILWNSFVSDASSFTAQIQAAGRAINPSEQLQGIILSPLQYLKTVILNYVLVLPGYPGDFTFTSMFGALGWGETTIPLWTITLYLAGLFLSLLHIAGRSIEFSVKQKLLITLVMGLFILGNITAMYVYLNSVGQSIIVGVQGRYFIPVGVLLLGLFSFKKKILLISEKTLVKVLGLTVFIVLLSTLFRIVIRYYA